MTLDSAQPMQDCAAELLQSGRLDGRELMALVGFDLAALPAGAELLYAGLELVTADQRFARPASAWHVEAVDLSAPSFSRLLADNRERQLSPWEEEELDHYVGMDRMLSLLKAKALSHLS